MEAWHFNAAIDTVYTWLWLRDRNASGNSTRQWFLLKGTAHDDKGVTSEFWPGGNTPPAYLPNGEPATGFKACEFSVRVRNENRATKLDLTMQIEPRQVAHHIWDFEAPFPASNQEILPNWTVQSADGVPLQIVAIRRFTSRDALPGWQGSRDMMPESGVAVVVRWMPVLGDKAEAWAKCDGAYDNEGTSWNKLPFSNQIVGDATQPQSSWSPGGKTQTFFFVTPQKISSLRLRLIAKESIVDGPPETLQFKNVAVPMYSIW